MKIASWNVNGIRAAMDKGLRQYVESAGLEMLCLQETKASQDQVDLSWAEELGYSHFWNSAEKKGYSGTCVLTRVKPKKISNGIGVDDHDREGRVITATFDEFHLVTVYTPNAQNGLARLDYRQQWDAAFLEFVVKLNRKKPVIFCGDLNVSHKEIDLARPKANRNSAGFTDEERAGFDNIVAAGFVDSFRAFDDRAEQYSWWSYRTRGREKNIGWRLDYFCVAKRFMPRVKAARIRQEILGSDHCPVELELE